MKNITVNEYFSQPPADRVLFDVRTPAEYEQGHVPGALNLPIFSDEERVEIGTLYKQVSPEKAYLRGLDLAGAKMSGYVKAAYRLAPGRQVAVHCWRGGKRSASMGTLLGFSGFDVQVLEGGYKAYRNYVLQQLGELPLRYLILGGKTGSGKTETLLRLREMGEQAVDLEGLAHHKGSAFGALGEQPQPRVEQFENDLFEEISRFDPQRRVWLENESRSIGKVFVPEAFWARMKSAPLIHLEMPFDLRVQRLAKDYAHFPKEDLKECVRKIEKRMGGQHVKAALEAFDAGDVAQATAIALHYYDKTYLHATAQGNFSSVHHLPVEHTDCQVIARTLIELANELQF